MFAPAALKTGANNYNFGDSFLDELDPSAFNQLDRIQPGLPKVIHKVEPTDIDSKKPSRPLPGSAFLEKKVEKLSR